MDDRLQNRGHKVSLSNRGTGSITGVKDVLSFDTKEILLETEQGMLMIKGEELHVSRLTVEKGEIEIDGRVDSLTYSNNNYGAKESSGIIGRLFK